MGRASIIHPGTGHISVFRIDRGQPRYTTVRRERDRDERDRDERGRDEDDGTAGGSTSGGSDDSGEPGGDKPIEARGDEDWWRRVPGIVAPGKTLVMREFPDVGAIAGAMSEIKATARAVRQAPAPAPHIVLVARHRGPLDSARVLSLCDDLGREAVDATIVIDHRD
jgi:hypothetical protein